MENLNLIVTENHIENLAEITKTIEDTLLDLNSFEYLETLLNKLKYANITNKDSLISLIETKLLEFKSLEQEKLSNKVALQMMKEFNSDLEKLDLIQTKKETNDSEKDIEYITITHDDGEVEMLVCAGENSLNSFIQSNINNISKMNAEDIFRYFKEYIHVDLKFYKEDEFSKVNPNLENTAIVKEEEIKKQELESIKEYSKHFGLGEDISITVDPNGERIYKIKDAVIKFYTDYENKRKMQVIKTPALEKTNDFENENDNKTEILGEEFVSAVNSDDADYVKEESTRNFDLDTLKRILVKRDVYELELTFEEEAYINFCINYLLDSMIERATIEGLDTKEQATLDDYIRPLIEKYETDKDSLSNTDINFVERYLENNELVKSRGLDKRDNIYKLTLEKKEKHAGVANIVLLLEIVTIGMLVLLFLSLDI